MALHYCKSGFIELNLFLLVQGTSSMQSFSIRSEDFDDLISFSIIHVIVTITVEHYAHTNGWGSIFIDQSVYCFPVG